MAEGKSVSLKFAVLLCTHFIAKKSARESYKALRTELDLNQGKAGDRQLILCNKKGS